MLNLKDSKQRTENKKNVKMYREQKVNGKPKFNSFNNNIKS